MSKSITLQHHFLVAMPTLEDHNFSKSVVYLCEHSEEGAMGLIVNKPLQVSLGNVLQHLNLEPKNDTIATQPVMMGGPVGQENGFVLHTPSSSDNKEDDIVVTSSKETLRSIANDNGPSQYVVTLGYAGWHENQLEEELTNNDWLIAPFHPDIIFNTPVEQRWFRAANLLGIDINQLSHQTGHA